MIEIRPLSKENMDEAIKVLDVEFNNASSVTDSQSAENYRQWLPASLPNGFNGKGLKAEHKVDYLQYWVAFDPEKDKVVGVTGLFTKSSQFKNQSDRAWLAWMGTSRKLSGMPDLPAGALDNVGIALMKFVIDMARSLGKRYFSAYLTDSSDDNTVRAVLKNGGFEDCDQEIEGINEYAGIEPGEQILYYQFDLRIDVN